MKVYTIEITNYKAFLGTHTIEAGGKNLFIYGENGSGKSSLYYALKDFFQSSVEDIDISALENVFVPEGGQGKTSVKVTLKPDQDGRIGGKSYTWSEGKIDSKDPADTSIRDGVRLKSFLTYKHLLGIHNVKKNENINIFNLLVDGVLKHFKYTLTGDKELGELWSTLQSVIARPTNRQYNIAKKRADVNSGLKKFNDAFGELFKAESPENILSNTRSILDKFNHNIEFDLDFSGLRPNKEYSEILGAEVELNLKYGNKVVEKPHLFLNEARLSAIAISLYLGMIKRHIQGIPCKILFLDDIFIGLDIANRLPLIDVLQTEFSDYQVFITTYDKPWFEYAKAFLEQGKWKNIEFYARTDSSGISSPCVIDDTDLIDKAKLHIHNCDFKSAAVYTRSAFEKLLRDHCDKKSVKVRFHRKQKNYTSEDFWSVVKANLSAQCIADVETYRDLVLNAFSHYNIERHEIRQELVSAVDSIVKLKSELESL